MKDLYKKNKSIVLDSNLKGTITVIICNMWMKKVKIILGSK